MPLVLPPVFPIDIHRFQYGAILADAASDQSDVGQGMVGAPVGAARPVDGQRAAVAVAIAVAFAVAVSIGVGQPAFQGAGGFGGARFGFNQRKVAIVNAGAADGAARHRGRRGGQFPQQRLGGQRPPPGVGDVGDQQVLAGSDADGAAAIAVGQVGHAPQLPGGDAPHRHAQPGVVEARLPLGMDADVVGMGIGAGIGAGPGQGAPQAGFQGGAEAGGAPFGQQKRQAGFVARRACAAVAEQPGDVAAQLGGIGRRREYVQRRGGRVAAGTHLAAHRHIEAGDRRAVYFRNGRREGDVLRCGVGAVFPATGNGNIELAGQVGELPVAEEHCGELPGNGRCVQQLAGRQAGGGAAHDGADVVHPGLQGNQPDGVQTRPDVRHIPNGEIPQLHLLAGGEVGKGLPAAAVAIAAAAAVVLADRRQGAELVGVADAVGDADAHHKPPRRLAAKENAGPLQTVPVRHRNGFPTIPAEGGDVPENVQAVLFGLDGFNLVHCWLPSRVLREPARPPVPGCLIPGWSTI